MYTANNKSFSSYFAAIAEAKAHGCDVIETATGARRWTPGTIKARKVAHVLRQADGSLVAFSKVR